MSDYTSVNEQLDWTKAGVIAAGVDVGAVTSKAAILVGGKEYAFSQVATKTPKESAYDAMNAVFGKTGLKLENIHYIVATGRGSSQVSFAHKAVSEISCAAAGAVRVWGPSVRTVLDAGGQSCRVIHCTEKGKATGFLYNDKCAAGIGRSLEIFGDLVQKDLPEMENIALECEKAPQLSDFCAVYAQSEALDLVRSRIPAEHLIAGYYHAMAKRITTLVSRAGLKKEFVVIGGLARNSAIMNWLETILAVTALTPKPELDPALATALGAALFADGFARK